MKQVLLLLFIFNSLAMYAQQFSKIIVEVQGTTRPITLAPIKGGSFIMGSSLEENGRNEDEGPAHKVIVDDFWMSEFEITWEQYEAFVYRKKENEKLASSEKLKALGIDGLTSATTPYVEMSFGMGKEGYPAVNVTNYAALMYCKWLSAMTGDFYRLPTEAEWEYVCKLGEDRVYTFGNNPDGLQKYAVINSEKYKKVGSMEPNEWGIYDIHGNVSEWTMDQYQPYTNSKSTQTNPWATPKTLYPRVARGGSWKSSEEESRCSSRLASSPRWKMRDPQLPKSLWWLTNAPFVGFRVVRPLDQPSTKEIEKFWLTAMNDYGQ